MEVQLRGGVDLAPSIVEPFVPRPEAVSRGKKERQLRFSPDRQFQELPISQFGAQPRQKRPPTQISKRCWGNALSNRGVEEKFAPCEPNRRRHREESNRPKDWAKKPAPRGLEQHQK